MRFQSESLLIFLHMNGVLNDHVVIGGWKCLRLGAPLPKYCASAMCDHADIHDNIHHTNSVAHSGPGWVDKCSTQGMRVSYFLYHTSHTWHFVNEWPFEQTQWHAREHIYEICSSKMYTASERSNTFKKLAMRGSLRLPEQRFNSTKQIVTAILLCHAEGVKPIGGIKRVTDS